MTAVMTEIKEQTISLRMSTCNNAHRHEKDEARRLTTRRFSKEIKGDGIDDPCPGTATWITSNQSYRNWSGPEAGVLWIQGDMGMWFRISLDFPQE